MSDPLPFGEITRYIFEKKHFTKFDKDQNPTSPKIKRNAVMPMICDSGQRETSVMGTSGLSENDVDDLGNNHVATLRGKELLAYARFPVGVPQSLELAVKNDKYEHARHCVIIDWPAAKEDIIEKAEDLAKSISESSALRFKDF